jgi:subtilisin family serine protease
VNIISIGWGLKENVDGIARVLNRALTLGIVIVAPKIHVGEDCPKVTFPSRLNNVLCIGSADGKGSPSEFYSSFMEDQGFSALGEGVMGALCRTEKPTDYAHCEGYYIRKDGTSTAALVAAGIAAFLLDYTQQFMDSGRDTDIHNNMRRLFVSMSQATIGQPYRFLAPWYLFGAGRNTRDLLRKALWNQTLPGRSTSTAIWDKTWGRRNSISRASGNPLPFLSHRKVVNSG